ncbi:uncharacterized protein si:dkeyp-117h8.4 [Pygocentrus nattereri]|uniref:Uncharacterized protein n=1 Tax=Pygocentrus nattereri TaxID=42514 RepID=A0A3B4BWG9_PYGNA|nr:uncharacterized protein si:dkeyp-117h8.4 [Pygocentrus nattereri]
MESPHGQASLKHQDRQGAVLDSFKRNDDIFRKTMEGIFQKYSCLDDPGLDVCFETMTFRTRKGVVPIDSAEAERELQHLRNRVNAEQSLRELESSYNEQTLSEQDMDRTRIENDVCTSSQMGNSDDSLLPGTETSQLSLNSVSASQSCLWEEQSQPEDEDENLERTLNSHGSTLLDFYPGMLNQIGEAYRRQHVTQAASAVLRRYRRKRWKSSQTQHRNHIPSNSLDCTLNKTMESSFSVRKLPHYDMTSHHNGMSSRSNQGISPLKTIRNSSLAASRSSQELSPLKTIRNSSLAASRSSQELSPLKTIRNSSLAASRSSQELSPLKTIRNSSLAASRSSQELSPLKTIRNSYLAASRSSQELSPLKTIRNSYLAASRSSQELSPLKTIRNSSLAASRRSQELTPLKTTRYLSLAASRSSQELSPLNTSSACFYSPRRVHVEETAVGESRSPFPASYLDTESQHRPVRVLEISTSPSSAASFPCSPSPDLNETYNIEPVAMPASCDVLASAAWSPSRSLCNSPLKGAKNSLFPGQGGRLITTSPSGHCHSQVGQQLTSPFVSKECNRDHVYSHSPSPQQAIVGGSFSVRRSPFKKVFSQELEQQTPSSIYYPKQTLPANHSDNSAVYRSPYRSQQGVSSSYRSYHPVSDHQENLAMAEVQQFSPRPLKCQRSFSANQSASSSMSRMTSRQIDAEFRRLYHHFICRDTSSSCSRSSCHLCEGHLEVGVQGSPTFSSNMSALALTPIQSRLKKRRRQYDGEESLRLKRFRESCSPERHTCLWPKRQQATKHVSTAVVNPTEEKCTWNRALLLQCPSPGFLRGSGDMRVSGFKPGLHSHSSSQRHVSGCIGPVEARSPMRTWNQSGVSVSPSLSRRRLLYAPLQ